MLLIYFLIAILATSAGALTGMGGGVILKPTLDLLGDFDAATVNVLSSVTVFSMTVVSVGRRLMRKEKPDFKFALPLASGSVMGGYIGQFLLAKLIGGISGPLTIAIQNSILAVLIIIIFVYMLTKSRLKSLGWHSVGAAIGTGLALGLLSSLLGIGGGPFNVALLIFLFAQNAKSATFYSLITILFAQSAKLITILADGGFSNVDLSPLPALVVGAVAGGLFGSVLHERFSEKAVDIAFNCIQVIVFLFCVVNIVRSC